MQLIPLGTNGFFPSQGRQTACFLVLGEGGALLLDAGTGVSRMAEREVAGLLDGRERLDVLLTHYHLDHVVGLSYLPGVWRGRAVRLFAPGPPLLQTAGNEALERLLAPPFFGARLAEFPLDVEVVPLSGEGVRIAGIDVRLRSQEHPGGSVGVRLGDRLAYVTDTVVGPGSDPFVEGVHTLLHEVWWRDGEVSAVEVARSGHATVLQVAGVATRAAVSRVMPVHHQPWRSAAELTTMARELAAGTSAEVEIPREGEVYEI